MTGRYQHASSTPHHPRVVAPDFRHIILQGVRSFMVLSAMPSIAIEIVNSLNGFVLVRLIVCHVQLLQQHCHAAAVAMVLVSADVHNCSHHKRSHHKHQGRVYHV